MITFVSHFTLEGVIRPYRNNVIALTMHSVVPKQRFHILNKPLAAQLLYHGDRGMDLKVSDSHAEGYGFECPSGQAAK